MWDFLDVEDMNLLYTYAEVLFGKRKQIQSAKGESENLEKKRKRAYYLIWFVYRYLLRCDTLEKAMHYADNETLYKYKLHTYFQHLSLYIGDSQNICMRKTEDIGIALEILYNRYNYIEQYDCFIRHTRQVRQSRCIAAKQEYLRGIR